MLVKEYIQLQNYSTPSRLGRIEILLSEKSAASHQFTSPNHHHNQHQHRSHQHHQQRQLQPQHDIIHGAPEAAANAMVSAVRMLLVALICVLLVKLSGPIKPRHKSHIGTDPQQERIYADEGNGGQSAGNGNTSDSNNNSNDDQLSSASTRARDSSSSLETHSLPRRNSQPELMSSSQAQKLQRERQRRHSEVNALSQLKVPPGPMGLPFLGYLPFVGKEIHLTFTSLSERFGPIYQIYLGNIRVVVLNEASLVRQAFKQPVFSGRPDTQLTRILQGYGIVNSEGALWKEQRAFLHSALRKLGAKSLMSGSNGLEAKIQVSELFFFLFACSWLRARQQNLGSAINPHSHASALQLVEISGNILVSSSLRSESPDHVRKC